MLRLRGGAQDPDHGMYVAKNKSVSYAEAWGLKKKKNNYKSFPPIPLYVMSLSTDNDVVVGYGAVADAS